MEPVSYSQVQSLVLRLPAIKLPIVYRFLVDLTNEEPELLAPQQEFMRLSRGEQQRALAKQAGEMLAHYEQTTAERQTWQAGDLIEY